MATILNEAPGELRLAAAPGVGGDRNQWAVLGGLRFLLALAVAVFHVGYRMPMPAWLNPIRMMGPDVPVVCFFAVSGFCMAHSIRGSRARDFYARRISRLYPVYFLTLLLAAMILPPTNRLQFVAPFLFLQNVIAPRWDSASMTWTLGCEAFYYLLTPWLARLRAGSLCGLAAASATFYLWWLGTAHPPLHDSVYGASHVALLWAWLLGFLAYRHRSRPLMWALFFVAGALSAQYDGGHYPLDAATWALTGAAFFWLPAQVRLSPRQSSILVWLGEISFPMYLLHGIVAQIAGPYSGAGGGPAILFASLVLSAAVWQFYDRPIQRTLKRSRGLTSPHSSRPTRPPIPTLPHSGSPG